MTTKRKGAKGAKKAARKATKKAAAKSRGPAKRMSPKAALSIATDQNKTVKQRVDAMPAMSLAATEEGDSPQQILKVVENQSEPVPVRLSALQSLAAAGFSAQGFESWRDDYIGTLRKISTDPNPEIRERALSLLAPENDRYAQETLLEGLKDPEKALVTPEKALQLLSYDAHNEAYSVAREIVDDPPNPEAKQEALRLLAADSRSAPLFEKLLRDKDERREVRQISASALHSLKPEKLKEHAREIVLDEQEYPEIKATSLTALTQFSDQAEVDQDQSLVDQVDKLSDKSPPKVKKTAKRFLKKFR